MDGSDGAGYLAESGGAAPGFDPSYTQVQLDTAADLYVLTHDPTYVRLMNLLFNQLRPRVDLSFTLDATNGTRKDGYAPFMSPALSVLVDSGARPDLASDVAPQLSRIESEYKLAMAYTHPNFYKSFEGAISMPILAALFPRGMAVDTRYPPQPVPPAPSPQTTPVTPAPAKSATTPPLRPAAASSTSSDGAAGSKATGPGSQARTVTVTVTSVKRKGRQAWKITANHVPHEMRVAAAVVPVTARKGTNVMAIPQAGAHFRRAVAPQRGSTSLVIGPMPRQQSQRRRGRWAMILRLTVGKTVERTITRVPP